MPTSGRAACPRVRLVCSTPTLKGPRAAVSTDIDPGISRRPRARVRAWHRLRARRRGIERQIDRPHRHLDAARGGGARLVSGMERVLAAGLRRFVLLIEEPELYLSPHAQRHLYRVLRDLAQSGNQILYSTHAPVFLSVDRLEELALVRHTSDVGTTLFQPDPLPEAESFRALSEFDSDRAELFLARAALLVEGRTEKLTFPFVFEALDVDADKEGIIVLECGGKGNMSLFARICNACGIPYVVVHDRDAPAGSRPLESERVVNRQIQEVAGRRRTVVLVPDFETISGVNTRGRSRKPHRAYRRYTGNNGDVPEPLKQAVDKVVRAARS